MFAGLQFITNYGVGRTTEAVVIFFYRKDS